MDITQDMRFTAKMDGELVERPQRGLLMKGDKNANRVILKIPGADLTGAAVTGTFTIAGVKIPLTGSAQGEEASVTLPQACYGEKGRYELRMMLTVGDVTRTMLFVTGQMESDGEGGTLDVENVIPSVQDIVAQYERMKVVTAETEAARDLAIEASRQANFTVLGRYETIEALRAAHPTGEAGQAYAVGSEENNNVYIWGIDVHEWVNIGPVRGAVGPTGPIGPQGPAGTDGKNGRDGTDGISPKVTVETITGGHRVRITDAEGVKVFEVLDGRDGTDGSDGADGESAQQFNQSLNTTDNVTFKSVTADVVYGAVFME